MRCLYTALNVRNSSGVGYSSSKALRLYFIGPNPFKFIISFTVRYMAWKTFCINNSNLFVYFIPQGGYVLVSQIAS